MRYIQYAQERLSKLSLGTVQFGLDYGIANTSGQPQQKDVNEIVDYLYAQGINCFDTAQAYGDSEAVLSHALEGKSDIFVISKLKSGIFQDDAQKSVAQSLRNLNIKSLYALLLHDSDLLYSWTDENSLTVDTLIHNGSIKHFGVSIYTDEEFQLAMKNEKITCIQIPFNLFDQRAVTQKWLAQAKETNRLIFIRSVFLQGLLLMDLEHIPPQLESAKKYIEDIESLCSDLALSKSELALGFVDTVAQDALVLFGCDNITQAKENIATYNTLKHLDTSTQNRILTLFKDVDESIYNPAKW